MIALRDRQKQIPNGLRFYQPETQWTPPPFSSFEVIVRGLMAHRMANLYLVQKHGWPVDYETVCAEVDAYNARICQQMGWREFITGDGEPGVPFTVPRPSLRQNARAVVAGAETLVDWIKSGAESVDNDQSAQRAATCVACPLNGKGDLTRWFTVPLSNAIRAAYNQRTRWHLSTPQDAQLGVCEACSCPLKLKVHVPLPIILNRIPPESKAALHPNCWILKEEKA